MHFDRLTSEHVISFGKQRSGVNGVKMNMVEIQFHFIPVMNLCHALHT